MNFRVGALLFVVPIVILPIAASFESAVRPQVLDDLFRALDLRLGLDGFALSRFCLAHVAARWLVSIVYSALPLVLALCWIAGRSRTFLRGALLGGVFSVPCYLIFPAVGPQYAFTNWPYAGSLGAIGPGHPRNCMPSMHFTWAFLAALNVRGKWRWLFALYALLMSLATVAGGEHYFIDILAAMPFSLAVQWAAQRLEPRTEFNPRTAKGVLVT